MAIIDIRFRTSATSREVAIIELLVKPGDTIKAEQSLITVESDKASMEIPSSHAGVVKELKVALGDKVSEGTLILTLEVAASPSARAEPVEARPRRQRPALRQAPVRTETAPRRQPHRHRRPRMRHAGARRRSGRLLGRLPRRGSGPEDRAGRALSDARRRMPQRRLHPPARRCCMSPR